VIQSRQKALVALILQTGMDPNIPNRAGRTALHDAVANGDRECIALLLSHGANIHVKDKVSDHYLCFVTTM